MTTAPWEKRNPQRVTIGQKGAGDEPSTGLPCCCVPGLLGLSDSEGQPLHRCPIFPHPHLSRDTGSWPSLSRVLPLRLPSPCPRRKAISCSEVATVECCTNFHCILSLDELGLYVLLDTRLSPGINFIEKCYVDSLSTRATVIFLKHKSERVGF